MQPGLSHPHSGPNDVILRFGIAVKTSTHERTRSAWQKRHDFCIVSQAHHLQHGFMQRKDRIEAYCKFARPYYAQRDSGHDFRHILRIIDRLESLSAGFDPPPKRHNLCFLAAFHGLNRKIDSDHAFRKRAIIFLNDLGWTDSETKEAFKSLNRHLSAPETPEEMIVHDANFFEVTGPFGIAKAFTVGGHFGQSYERTLKIFKDNVKNLTFFTPTGQSLYEERRKYCTDFIERLQQELELSSTVSDLEESE